MGNNGSTITKQNVELTQSELEMLKEMTKFSEKDILEWHAGFYHDCPEGKLERKKFLETFEKYYVRGPRAVYFCDYVFDMLDKDNDGTINFVEFLLSIASTSQGDLNKRLELAFHMYDVSSDGSIDQQELANLISAMYNLVGETNRKGDRDPKRRAMNIINEYDQDHNGRLTKNEFFDALNKDQRLVKMLAPYL